MRKPFVLIFVPIFMASCAPVYKNAEYLVSDGDRAAGKVIVVCNASLQNNSGGAPIYYHCDNFDIEELETKAAKKCNAWGYQGAEAFGGYIDEVYPDSIWALNVGTRRVNFQCVGDLEQ